MVTDSLIHSATKDLTDATAYVSMQRIEHFLKEDEVPEWASTLTASSSALSNGGEVGFSRAVFQWQALPKSGSSLARFQLGPLDLTFPKGKISLISGPTGSGKSALLAALLGGQAWAIRLIFTS